MGQVTSIEAVYTANKNCCKLIKTFKTDHLHTVLLGVTCVVLAAAAAAVVVHCGIAYDHV